MSLYIRSLTEAEGNRLQHIMRHSKNAVSVRRAQVFILSDQHATVQEIALHTFMHEEYIRELIRRFNAQGMSIESILCRPKWLNPSASRHCVRSCTRTESNCSARKRGKNRTIPSSPQKKRLNKLYKRIPKGAHVVCFDEFGLIELRPVHGQMWANQGHVDRLPATYTKQQGVRHWLAFYDVATDQLWGYITKRKRGSEIIRVFKRLRAMYPAEERNYLILDNFSPHGVKEVRRFAKKNKITLIWTPTNASWVNRIECQFTELKRFVFHNTNYQSHAEVRTAMLKFLRYRHSRNKKRKLKLTI